MKQVSRSETVLGISAYYHDSAAALLVDGEIRAAAQEERFSRQKFDARFPKHAVQYCLDAAGLSLAQVDHVAFHDKPLRKFQRLISTYADHAPRGFPSFRRAMPAWLGGKLYQQSMLTQALRELGGDAGIGKRILFAEHHQSHAASAFYPSPFEEAVIVTMDGVGEWATSTIAVGEGDRLMPRLEQRFPHSTGLFYSAMTQYLGFKVLSGEYKVMGLAPYGVPEFRDILLDEVVDLKPDGSLELNQDYFDYAVGQAMCSDRFPSLFGRPARTSEEDELTSFHMNMAASLQAVTEEIVLRTCRTAIERFEKRKLCLAGGVALNCVANGRVWRELELDGLWVQPAANDSGCALGAALATWHQHLGRPRAKVTGHDRMKGAYLGPEYNQDEIETYLTRVGASFETVSGDDLSATVARLLADGKAVGWMQGRMEFGPRALGNRSILADPRRADVQSKLNLQVKYRESFRPFAPAVLEGDVADWFDHDAASPYMLKTANVREEHLKAPGERPDDIHAHVNQVRSTIPAVTHVDNSARIQTVSERTNPAFHTLLTSFKELTGCPILVNTSFNVRGEPIVCTPEDAFRCFMGTEIDVLVVGRCILLKEDQDASLKSDHRNLFQRD
ncbi:MAG: carbamoyltransferase [Pseudomonadota bacterium]